LKQHKFCRKPFNEHSYHARFQFAKCFQRRRLKSKSVQKTDAKGEQYVTQHLYSSFRVVIHLDDPPFGESNSPSPHSLKRFIQLCDTNQVHNSDEGCNRHVRYCCNLASVVLCKLSQLNLSETTGLNGTKLFLEN
jgi:hypothetical protein